MSVCSKSLSRLMFALLLIYKSHNLLAYAKLTCSVSANTSKKVPVGRSHS